MKAQPESKIAAMLMEAYRWLGVYNVSELQCRTEEALEYLRTDREHYIEVADKDTPEYHITTKNGVICKLIPLAREIIRDQEKDHVREHISIFSLMLSDAGNRCVYSYGYAKLYSDPSQNSYSYPVYRYADPEDIRKDLIVSIVHSRRWNLIGWHWKIRTPYGSFLPSVFGPDKRRWINRKPVEATIIC